jgi:hypothetical protein
MSQYCPAFTGRDWGKLREVSVRTVDVLFEIQFRQLGNASQNQVNKMSRRKTSSQAGVWLLSCQPAIGHRICKPVYILLRLMQDSRREAASLRFLWVQWTLTRIYGDNSHEELKVEVTLRPSVSRPVSLGVRPTSGTRDQFFFHLDNFFRHLWGFYFVAPSLTRGRACNLLLLLVLASAVTLGLPFLTSGQVRLLSSFC